MEAVSNAVSISFIMGVGLPALLFFASKDLYFMTLTGAIVATSALVSWLKPLMTTWFPRKDWLQRPAGARDCGIWCNGGASGGRPGFPSGHMTITTMCVVGLWLRNNDLWTLWLGVPWVVAMGWARWAKQCHNWQQIIGGVLLGGLSAMGLHWTYTHTISD